MPWFLLATAVAAAPLDTLTVSELVARTEQPLTLPARRAAVRALGTHDGPDAVAALLDRCRDEPSHLCPTAIQTLDRLGDQGVSALLQILTLEGPARSDKGRAWEALKDQPPTLRREAALQVLPHHRSLPPQVVREGLQALTPTHPDSMRELASLVASDPMERTALRVEALALADSLDAPGRHHALASMVHLPDPRQREALIATMANPQRPGRIMLPALVDLAFDADRRVRMDAVTALRGFAHPTLRTRMRWLVDQDPRAGVRLAALPLLAALADREDLDDVTVLTEVLEGALNRRGRLVATAVLATRSDPTWADLVSDRIIDIDPVMGTMKEAIQRGVGSAAELGVTLDPPVRPWTPEDPTLSWEPAWVRDGDGVLQPR